MGVPPWSGALLHKTLKKFDQVRVSQLLHSPLPQRLAISHTCVGWDRCLLRLNRSRKAGTCAPHPACDAASVLVEREHRCQMQFRVVLGVESDEQPVAASLPS